MRGGPNHRTQWFLNSAKHMRRRGGGQNSASHARGSAPHVHHEKHPRRENSLAISPIGREEGGITKTGASGTTSDSNGLHSLGEKLTTFWPHSHSSKAQSMPMN